MSVFIFVATGVFGGLAAGLLTILATEELSPGGRRVAAWNVVFFSALAGWGFVEVLVAP
jgi:hypothetical protein